METKGNWIQTHGGVAFDLVKPTKEMVRIEDIAHSLGMLCRFNGHLKKFYSVAEHCYWASYICDPAFSLKVLIHDAGEAYVSDLPRPIKRETQGYDVLEAKVMAVIYEALQVSPPSGDEQTLIDNADNRMLKTERDQLLGYPTFRWKDNLEALETIGVSLPCWDPEEASHYWLDRYFELTREGDFS